MRILAQSAFFLLQSSQKYLNHFGAQTEYKETSSTVISNPEKF